MEAYQVRIPAENKPGVLSRVTAALSREKINIRATTISSFGERGFFNLIVDDPERAKKALNRDGIEAQLREVVAVLITDQPGGLDKLAQFLAAENVNIENAYGFVIESRVQAVFVLEVSDTARVKELLKKAKFEILSSRAMADIEPFHYMKY
ncbi:MAG: ACT domain-containing protein [Desulfobulbaceae bacterium]|nr:ACT domain-containing protein [Desulfobulbaceae bacterium]